MKNQKNNKIKSNEKNKLQERKSHLGFNMPIKELDFEDDELGKCFNN